MALPLYIPFLLSGVTSPSFPCFCLLFGSSNPSPYFYLWPRIHPPPAFPSIHLAQTTVYIGVDNVRIYAFSFGYPSRFLSVCLVLIGSLQYCLFSMNYMYPFPCTCIFTFGLGYPLPSPGWSFTSRNLQPVQSLSSPLLICRRQSLIRVTSLIYRNQFGRAEITVDFTHSCNHSTITTLFHTSSQIKHKVFSLFFFSAQTDEITYIWIPHFQFERRKSMQLIIFRVSFT